MTTWKDWGATAYPDWIERYLDVLGVPHDAPSLEHLAALTRAHILTIPFENVTSLRRRATWPTGPVPVPDPELLLAGWEKGQGGGVCFELASMFHRLLSALGYRATLILGQISFPGSHQAVLVELDGARYLADVGNGAPMLDPIPLNGVVEVHRAGLAYRFRPGDEAEEWVQDRLIHGEWTAFCRYTLRPAREEELDAGYQGHHTLGQSWVVDRLRLVRCGVDSVVSLTDDELVRFSAEGKSTELIGDPADYERLIVEVFRIPALPIAEALDARRELSMIANGS